MWTENLCGFLIQNYPTVNWLFYDKWPTASFLGEGGKPGNAEEKPFEAQES
jgi:hypothetical protein